MSTNPESARSHRDGSSIAARREDGRWLAAALNLDLTTSWVIGDRPEDMGLAQEIGACAINLGPEPCDLPRVWSFASLAEAAPFILDRVRT